MKLRFGESATEAGNLPARRDGGHIAVAESASMFANQTGTNYYFGGKLIKNADGYLATDRLGSIGKYYPYGQEKGTGNPATGEKFTGYFRIGETELDYAEPEVSQSWRGSVHHARSIYQQRRPDGPWELESVRLHSRRPCGRIDPSGTCDLLPGGAIGGSDCDPFGWGTWDTLDPTSEFFCTPPPPPPPTTPPPPTCEEVLTANLQGFLLDNDPGLLVWDPNLANDLVSEGASGRD